MSERLARPAVILSPLWVDRTLVRNFRNDFEVSRKKFAELMFGRRPAFDPVKAWQFSGARGRDFVHARAWEMFKVFPGLNPTSD